MIKLSMSNEQIISKINEVMADEFEADVSLISPDENLMETLDLDSLDLVDIVVLIEKNFGVTLTGADFVNVSTFQNLYDLIIAKI